MTQFSTDTQPTTSARSAGQARRFSDPAQRAAMSARQREAKAHMRSSGYNAIHSWLGRHFPRTGICEECGESPESKTIMRRGKPVVYAGTEWANVSGEYKRDRDDYRELCRVCHCATEPLDAPTPTYTAN